MISRTLVLLLAGVAALLTCPGCSKPAAELPPTPETPSAPIKGGGIYWPGAYWLDIANKKGWFREAAVNVEVVNTDADYFASLEGLAKGELDFVLMPFFDFVRFNADGKRLTAVLITDYSNGAEALVARPGIASIADLKGKKVGMPKNTYVEYIFTVISQRAGLKPGDVELVDTPIEGIEVPFSEGKLDAIFAWEPNLSNSIESVPGSKKLFSTSDIPGIAGGTLTFRSDFVEERRDDVMKIMEVWRRTSRFIQDSPDAACAIVAEIYEQPVDEVKAFMDKDRPLNLRNNELAFSYASGFDSIHGAVRQMNDFMLERNLTSTRLDSQELVDPSFVRELARRASE